MPPQEIFVADTSSIIQVRRLVPPRQRCIQVYGKLGQLVESDLLAFPIQVHTELERYTNPTANPSDLPYEWADQHKERCTRHGMDHARVAEVLALVPDILDPNKDGVEEADAYVLALALGLTQEGSSAVVITEETKDRPDKMSMTTACGMLRLHRLPMEAFLRQRGIWVRPLTS